MVPAGITAVAVVGVGLVPALAASSTPALPRVSGQQLVADVLAAPAHQPAFSGTFQVAADVGVPSQLLGALPSALGGASGAAGGTGAPALQKEAESDLAGLLSGTHTFQVAADPAAHRVKVVATDLPGGELAAVRDGGTAWLYDAHSRTAVHLTGNGTDAGTGSGAEDLTPQQAAAKLLRTLGSSTDIAVSGQTEVAGRSAYNLVLRPKGSGSTVGQVRIAVDGRTHVPLQVEVLPAAGGAPIADLRFTTVDFATPAASAFAWTPPRGTTVEQHAVAPADGVKHAAPGAKAPSAKGMAEKNGPTVVGSGWTAVYEFTPGKAEHAAGQKTAAPALGDLKGLGKAVPGGTLLSTRAVNVLIGTDGTVYAGAVTPNVLEHAAGH